MLVPCPGIVALPGVRDRGLYHVQLRGHSPAAHLGCYYFSPGGCPEPQLLQGAWLKMGSSLLGVTFPFGSLLNLTPVLEVASFPSPHMMPTEAHRTGDISCRRKKKKKALAYYMHYRFPCLELKPVCVSFCYWRQKNLSQGN